MRQKTFRPESAESRKGDSRRIRDDLERRGVAPAFSTPIAERLTAIAPDLTRREYVAVLDGVAAAYGVHREVDPTPALRSSGVGREDGDGDVDEIRRLMGGFTDELRKLEEGLQILSAYVMRMGHRAAPETPPTLH